MNRAKIYSNRRRTCISLMQHRNGRQKRTWPKPKGCLWSLLGTIVSTLHIQKVMGTSPMVRKNTNGYRRVIVFLFV